VQHGKQANGILEAKRRAEALFETKTVAEIREIEGRTRKDIELKKQQLRQLVGDSYRDLIESADKIVAIANSCGVILNNVRSIQGSFTSLAHSFTSTDNMLNEKRDSLTKHEELYAVGSRVKYLVDTPEMIWGCLDSQQYLEAARRYLRAEHVHALLGKSFPPDMLSKFPLLSHQWPLVHKFKKQIIDAVQASLTSDVALATEQVADAIAAVSSLQHMDSQSALLLLLSSRRTWIAQQLQQGDSLAAGPSRVAELLADIAQLLQTTFSQVGELFLAGSKPADAGNPTCMLQAAVREDELDASELLFAGHGSSDTASAAAAPEMEAWQRSRAACFERLVALTSGQVEKACTHWLREVSGDFAQRCCSLLKACDTTASLMEVENAVRTAITKWQPASAATAANKRRRAGGPSSVTAASSAASATYGAAAAADSAGQVQSWDAVCEWVLGFTLNLWQEVFHSPFLTHAKELIACSFAAVGQAVEVPLQECLASAAASRPDAPGEVPSSRWPAVPWEGASGAGSLHRSSSTAWSEKMVGMRSKGEKQGDQKGFRWQVQVMRQRFDEELKAVLQSVLQLLSSDSPQQGAYGLDPAGRALRATGAGVLLRSQSVAGGPGRKDVSVRAAELEPFVQQKCSDLAMSIVMRLQAHLEQSKALTEGVAGAVAAEHILLISRLCSAIAGESRFLQVILGPPEGWRPAASGASASTSAARASVLRGAATRGAAVSQRLQAVVQKFRTTAITGFKLWAQWAGESLAKQLRHSVTSDELLGSLTTPLSWQEVVVAGSTGSGTGLDDTSALLLMSGADAGAHDMRFSLPACPSASLMQLLMSACQELRRAGDHAICTEALQIFEWELAGAAFKAVASVLQTSSPVTNKGGAGLHNASSFSLAAKSNGALSPLPESSGLKLSEKGVLQLLLDVRLLRDVLAGGRPLDLWAASSSAGTPGLEAAVPQSSLLTAPLLQADLQDPAVMAAVVNRKREVSNLEQQLQDRLDPIDWATYEPYLWANVQRYYQRVAILYGSLVQLQRVHPETGASGRTQLPAGSTISYGATAAAAEMNPINVLPVVPRFQYLPISAPSAGAAGSSTALAAAGGMTSSRSRLNLVATPASSNGNLAAASTGDLAGSYSFAELGSSRAALTSTMQHAHQPQPGQADAAGSSSAFSQFQARLQAGSLGTLGSMLGDKAAEMTAMAQQRFDNIADYLPTAALGSGLLSSFAKTVKK